MAHFKHTKRGVMNVRNHKSTSLALALAGALNFAFGSGAQAAALPPLVHGSASISPTFTFNPLIGGATVTGPDMPETTVEAEAWNFSNWDFDFDASSDWSTPLDVEANIPSSAGGTASATTTTIYANAEALNGSSFGEVRRLGKFTFSGVDIGSLGYAIFTVSVDYSMDLTLDATAQDAWGEVEVFLGVQDGSADGDFETNIVGADFENMDYELWWDGPGTWSRTGSLEVVFTVTEGATFWFGAEAVVDAWAAPVPIPTPFLLLGSALVALFTVSRRRSFTSIRTNSPLNLG